MTLGRYYRPNNGCARVSRDLPDDTNRASERGVWEGCVVAGNIPQESPYITMAMRLCEAAEPTNTPTNATRAAHTQPRFAQPHSSQRPAFPACWWLPSGTDHAAQPTRRQQPPTARAPAGRHSQTGSQGFRPLDHRPLPLLHSSRGPRDPAGSAVPTDALRSPSTAAQPCISTREAPRKSATQRRSPPPTP